MFYVIGWFVVVALLAIWSLSAWTLHAAAAWAVSNAGALTDAASSVGGSRLPDWLMSWVPPELVQPLAALLADFGAVAERLLQAAPALESGLTLATWVVWGIGSALLVMLGAGVHLLIAVWRRRARARGPRPGRVLAAD